MNKVDRIKQAASGRWIETLSMNLLRDDSQGQPCPKCGGDDRFNLDQDFKTNGKIYCRQCLPRGSGDGIGTYAWLNDVSNSEAIDKLAKELGIEESPKNNVKSDKAFSALGMLTIIDDVCTNKRITKEAFQLFGVVPAKRGRERRNVARITLYDEHGEKFPASVTYFDLWPGSAGEFKLHGKHGLFLPGSKPQPGEAWLIVEGVKDAAALITLGFPKVCGLPTSNLATKFAGLFKGCEVTVVPDLDSEGQKGSEQTCKRLTGIAASLRKASLPGEIVKSGGLDVRDIRDQHGPQAVLDAIANAQQWQPTEDESKTKGRPEVLLDLDEGAVADEVVKHLGNLGWNSEWIPEGSREQFKVYAKGGQLVHVVPSEDPSTLGQLSIQPIPTPIVRERITQACQLGTEKSDQDGNLSFNPERPPKWLIDAVATRTSFNGHIKPLSGLIQSPTLRADGTIIQTPGYDSATGLIYLPNADYPLIPESPTKEDARAAWQSLSEVIADYPMISETDRSAWLSMVLSMIARTCIAGNVPMFAIDSNCRGTGKSMLADAASIIAYGYHAARQAFTSNDAEQRKLITSIVMAGKPSVLFDNLVDVSLGGSAIDQAITGTVWSDRELKTNRVISCPMNVVWLATGNNISYGTDIGRRVMPIRIHTSDERPEERKDFRHNPLLSWVSDNRGKLAVDALTILRAYFAAGKPRVDREAWGSFESWTEIIRGAIVWAGLTDPLPNREHANRSDVTRELLGLLVTGLIEHHTPIKAIDMENVEDAPALTEAIKMICPTKFNPRTISQRLASYRGRKWNGWEIDSLDSHGGVKSWFAKSSDGGKGGKGGKVFNQSYAIETGVYHSESPLSTPTRLESPLVLNEKQPTEATLTTIDCPKCGTGMNPAAEVNGWRNLDCPSCGHVVPQDLSRIKKPTLTTPGTHAKAMQSVLL